MSGIVNANQFALIGDVWKPRFRVFVGAKGVHAITTPADQLVPTALSVMVQKQNWYQADRHKITFSLWQDQAYGYAFWAAFNSMSVLIEIGFIKNGAIDYVEVFRGFVDKLVIDTVKGIVTLTGRNIFGQLADGREISVDNDDTIGDILKKAFTAQGLPAPDLSQIGDIAGQTFGKYNPISDTKDVVNTGHNTTLGALDAVTTICRQFGIFYYEDGGDTFFKKQDFEGTQGFTALAPQPIYESPGVTKLLASNCTFLTIEHDLNIAQWDWYIRATNYGFPGTADGHRVDFPPENVDSATGKAFHAQSANKTAEDNKTYAISTFNEFTLHEWVVTAKVAGPQILGLKLNNLIVLQGTQVEIMDGVYLIDTIEHECDFQRGYIGTVKGRWGAGAAGQTGAGASGP